MISFSYPVSTEEVAYTKVGLSINIIANPKKNIKKKGKLQTNITNKHAKNLQQNIRKVSQEYSKPLYIIRKNASLL